MRACELSLFLAVPFIVFADAAVSDERKIRLSGDVTEERVARETRSGENWLVNGGRFSGEHYSPLTQIDDSNVARLGLAWVTDIPSFTMAAEPLVVDGVVYLSGGLNWVFALDAVTGEVLWKFDPQVRLDLSIATSFGARMNRGVAVWKGVVYTGTGDCRLIAIDATSGEKLWEARVCDAQEGRGAAIRLAPRVGGGLVFMGHAGSDYQVRSSLSAFDAATGEEVWRFWTVPGDPAKGAFETPELERASKTWARGWAEKGGGAIWEGIRYDPATQSVFFGTASASPMNVKRRGPGDNLFTNCIMAVDAATGRYKWHYQTVPSDAWNYDASMPLIVTNLELNGVRRRVVMQAPKNGFFYVLDARTGELLAADPIVKVTWATHIDMKTGRPVEVPGARYYENEDSDQPVRIAPTFAGAHNWQAMSFSSRTGLVYVPVTDMAANFSAGGFFGARTDLLGYGPEEEVPLGVGKLLAWDPVGRRARWSVDYPLAFNGGVLSTAGDLVFHGTGSGEFRAYRAASGELLWSRKTGTSILAAPVSYRAGGEQYVLVGAGIGGALGIIGSIRASSPDAQGPSRLFAFKLDGKAPMPPSEQRLPPVPRPPPRATSAEQVERGAEVWLNLGCEICHGEHVIGVGPRDLPGALPDLRYMAKATHEEWHGIVLGGNRRLQGMPSFRDSLSVEDSEALQAYVIEQSWKAYEGSASEPARYSIPQVSLAISSI